MTLMVSYSKSSFFLKRPTNVCCLRKYLQKGNKEPKHWFSFFKYFTVGNLHNTRVGLYIYKKKNVLDMIFLSLFWSFSFGVFCFVWFFSFFLPTSSAQWLENLWHQIIVTWLILMTLRWVWSLRGRKLTFQIRYAKLKIPNCICSVHCVKVFQYFCFCFPFLPLA